MLPVRKISIIVAASLLAAPGLLPAQRFYQKYWEEKLKEMPEPTIIEDNAPERDLEAEKFLFGDDVNLPMMSTVFPGSSTESAADPVPALAIRSYIEGAVASESGSYTQAMKSFIDAAEKDPGNIWIQLRAAETAAMLNDTARAHKLLDDVIASDPENYRAMLKKAEIFSMQQKYEDARTWYTKVLDIVPRNIDSLQALAQIAYEIDRDFEKTKEYSKRILHIDDKNPHAMLMNAEASAFTGDVIHAADLYAQLIRYRPGLIDRMGEIGRRLAMTGRTDDARIMFEKAMLISPQQEALRAQWEVMLRQIGGEEELQKGYHRIVEESRGDLQIYELQAGYLKRQNQWPELVKLREEMLKIEPNHLQSLLDIAYHHLSQKDFAAAEPYFERAEASNPTDPDVYRQMAGAYLLANNMERARDLYERVLIMDPKDSRSLDALAAIYEMEGDPAEAEKLLKRALDASPANAEVLQRLGAFYLRSGDRARAQDYFQQVLATDSAEAGAWLQLARIYFEDENDAQLRILDQQADIKLRTISQFWASYGHLAQEFGDYERSRRALERALQLVPEDFVSRMLLSRTYLHLQMRELAFQVMEDGRELSEGNPELTRKHAEFMGLLYMDALQYAKAEEQFGGLLKQHPDDFAVRGQYLTALLKQGKDEEVTKVLNDTVREFGVAKQLETQILRATILRLRGEASRAVSVLRTLLADHPENADVMVELAISTSEADDLKTAENLYRKLMDLGPPETNEYYEVAANNLAFMFAQRDLRLDEAEELAGKALALNPNAAYILDTVGWVHYRKGDHDKARKYLERAARLALNDGEVYSNLGQLYETIGEQELARGMYERALAVDPTSKVARERRDALAGTPSAGRQMQ